MPGAINLGHALVAELLGRCRFPVVGPVRGERSVVCAVSGGPDSTALAVLAVASGLDATLIHIDHGLRPGSDGEAAVVEELAEGLGCCFVGRCVVIEPGPNLEARARAARYAALPDDVLTGHTLDDQAETVLLNLLRGGALDALAGMDPDGRGRRRPLLAIRRSETVALCDALGLKTTDDPSNSDPAIRRNRVRHELLPLLDAIAQRDTAEVLARQADLARAEAALLDELAADIDPTDALALSRAPLALARRALRRWLASLDPECHPPSAASVARCLEVATGEARACELPGGWRVSRHGQRLRISASGRSAGVPGEDSR